MSVSFRKRSERDCRIVLIGVEIDIHQLRHAHATELINAGVFIETETTQLHALLDDRVADAEIRAARRRRDRASR